jgi:hypothetical protein
MRRSLLLLTVVLCAASSSEARVRAVRHLNVWAKPACTGIQGLASIRFVEPTGTVRKSYFYAINKVASPFTAGVVPNTLYAVYDERLYESTDAGCSWTLRMPLPEIEVAYDVLPSRESIYVVANQKLVRITGPMTEGFDLPARMAGLAVNPADSLHLRGLGRDGVFYESRNGGIVWDPVGGIPDHSFTYSIAFDPRNFDHVLAGVVLNRGAIGTGMTTRDGGRSWTRTPFPAASVLADTMAFSPADPNVVWMIGADMTERKTHLYRSNDGGTTFAARLTGPFQRVVVPHPRDPNVVATSIIGEIAIVSDAGITILPGTHFEKMVWAPSGTLYFSAADEAYDF